MVKAKTNQKVLTKLTNYHTKAPVYVDLNEVMVIDTDYVDHYTQGSTGNTFTSSQQEATRLLFSNAQIIVAEHIQVIIALIEGRDPSPAQVMYGRKS